MKLTNYINQERFSTPDMGDYCDEELIEEYLKSIEEQNQSDVIKDQESKKLDLLYVYLINGPQECKYITSMDITTLNQALRYHKFKEINPSDLINAKQYNSIYGLYILASSKEELEDKIKKYNNEIIENVK